MRIQLRTTGLVLICLFATVFSVSADNHKDGGKSIIPASEMKMARELAAEGPAETTGIESAKLLGSMSLTGEFAGTENHMLRVREVTVLPGGQVAVHQHNSRPGVAYILEGEVVEHRNDTTEALTRTAGAIALEKTGTIHWWKNESGKKARVLVVDIVPKDTE